MYNMKLCASPYQDIFLLICFRVITQVFLGLFLLQILQQEGFEIYFRDLIEL